MRTVRWVAGAVVATALAATGIVAHGGRFAATDAVTGNLVMIATAVGVVVAMSREKRVADLARREQERHDAVRDERLRIARDLHDVLAHDLTLINVQAGVAEYLLRRDPEAAATALRDITDHTARAVDDLRATLRLLRQHGDDEARTPVPGFADLDELLSAAAGRGTVVGSSVEGDPRPLAPATDLAAYRIAQEALTNVARHAPGSPAEVSVVWSAGQLTLEIANRLTTADDPVGEAGHGLIGMRERVASVGGAIEAGPTGDGRFRVRAVLPNIRDAEPT